MNLNIKKILYHACMGNVGLGSIVIIVLMNNDFPLTVMFSLTVGTYCHQSI